MIAKYIKIKLQRWVMNVYNLLILKYTYLCCGFRGGESMVCKTSNMSQKHPSDGRVEMTKSKPHICLSADIQGLIYNSCPLLPALLHLLFYACNTLCHLMGGTRWELVRALSHLCTWLCPPIVLLHPLGSNLSLSPLLKATPNQLLPATCLT